MQTLTEYRYSVSNRNESECVGLFLPFPQYAVRRMFGCLLAGIRVLASDLSHRSCEIVVHSALGQVTSGLAPSRSVSFGLLPIDCAHGLVPIIASAALCRAIRCCADTVPAKHAG